MSILKGCFVHKDKTHCIKVFDDRIDCIKWYSNHTARICNFSEKIEYDNYLPMTNSAFEIIWNAQICDPKENLEFVPAEVTKAIVKVIFPDAIFSIF